MGVVDAVHPALLGESGDGHGHPSDDHVPPGVLHERLEHGVAKRSPLRDARPHMVNGPPVYVEGPEELLEVHRVHADLVLVSDRIWRDIVLNQADERTRGDDVVAAVRCERLQRCAGAGAVLDLIEEDQRPVRSESALGMQGAELHDDSVHVQVAVEGLPRPPVETEVHYDDVLVVLLAEAAYGVGLAHLSRPADQKAPPPAVVLPFSEPRLDLPPHRNTIAISILITGKILTSN